MINQSILAKCPVLEGSTEKPSTNCKTTQLTPERNVYKAVRSTGEKGLILPGWGRGVGSHKVGPLCTRSERVGQIYSGGDWLKGRGNWNKGKETETRPQEHTRPQRRGEGSRNPNPGGAPGVSGS